jgi:hypothetical protein
VSLPESCSLQKRITKADVERQFLRFSSQEEQCGSCRGWSRVSISDYTEYQAQAEPPCSAAASLPGSCTVYYSLGKEILKRRCWKANFKNQTLQASTGNEHEEESDFFLLE